MKVNLIPPTIPEDEKSPFVLQLASFIEQQGNIIQQQAEQIQQLKDEIARLKNQPPKPDIKPSSLGKKKKDKSKKRLYSEFPTSKQPLKPTNTVIEMNLYCTKILRNLFRNIYITHG